MYFVVTSPVVMLQNGINYSLIEIKTISFGMSELLVISVSSRTSVLYGAVGKHQYENCTVVNSDHLTSNCHLLVCLL